MPGTHNIDSGRLLRTVAAVLGERRAQGWLVGGSVRDRELGRCSPDSDVVVTGDAAAISRDVARLLGLPWFALSEEFRAYRVVGAGWHLDVAAVRGGAIEADLAERDFTVNAMARPLGADGAPGGLVDPFGGLADLQAGRLAAVSERIFTSDPLRLMRAVRFSHILGLRFDPALWIAVQSQASAVVLAAPERVTTEMVLTLDAGRAGQAAHVWQESGLLGPLVPELQNVAGAGPGAGAGAGPWPALDRLEGVLADPAGAFPSAAEAFARRLAEPVDGSVSRPTALRIAGVLTGVDADRIGKVGRRLKLSGPLVSLVETAARVSGLGPLPAVAPPPAGPGRDAVEYLWDVAPWQPETLALVQAAGGDPAAAGLMALWARREADDALHLPLDGDDLMRELDLEPGPRLGRALRAARLAWEAGEATTAAQALAAARAALDEP